jgi:putative ABC transport system permease protein
MRLHPLARARRIAYVYRNASAAFLESVRMKRSPAMSVFRDLGHDLRYAARTLATQRLFAAAAALMLALGIGANGAMFALVDAILLRPLPFPEPDRLVMVWERDDRSLRGLVSPGNLPDWNERNTTFTGIAGFVPNVGNMVLANDDGTAETIPRQWVSSGIFDVLAVQPIVGRTFRRSDDDQRANVVILTESFWRSHFTADPAVVGRALRLDGDAFTVVGVVPDEAQVIGRTSMWALSTDRFSPAPPPGLRGARFAQAIGRLKPGVAIEAAADQMTGIAASLAQEFPATNRGRSVALEPMREAVLGRELRVTSMLFLGVVGLVLLICCANVANLLLTRATVRRRELAVRSALGADRWRVIRQLVAESLLLATLGGLLGVAIGAAILRAAPSVIPPDLMPVVVTLSFDWRIIGFCATTALGVGLLFGLVPAWQAANLPLAQIIASESRSATGRGGRTRAGLVVGQVATAVVLLFGAGLLLRTLLNLEQVDRGYRADSVLTMLVDALDSRHGGEAGLLRFYDAISSEILKHPGVRDVAWATTLPMGQSYQGSVLFEPVGDPSVDESTRPLADYQIVSSTYFGTLDLPVVQGRSFDDRDRDETVPVCLVNEAIARRYFQGRSPVGAQLALRPAGAPQGDAFVRQIVGVVRQVKGRPDEADDFLQVYVPLTQNTPGDIFLFVRPDSGDADVLGRPVQAAIWQVDREQVTSVNGVMTLEDIASDATARHRFRAVLVTTFAMLALVLAMIGVFGVLAYTVEQRIRDFGVRRALGATTGDVVRLVAGSGGRLVAIGIVIGLGVSMAFSRLLASLLVGVRPLDLLTFAAVAIALTFTAALAMLAPAWRAVRVDPVIALRAD